jgi:threonine aldolase
MGTTVETAQEEAQAREREAIFAACDRFVGGHGRVRPHAELADLAQATATEEEPDHYGTGAVIEDFEREVATLLGKEAAIFMPSGTMAQQIALRVWSERCGSRTVAFHPTCHLEGHEQKGYQLLHGLHGRLVGDPHELVQLKDLVALAEPVAALLLELPQREIGGQLPAWDELHAQVACAHQRGAVVHMDGARLWEAGPFYGRSYAEIAAPFDSVYVSFYKGIGAIAGAALAGPAAVMAEARVWQRRHGGNLVHLYPFVLSARLNLRRRLERFPAYHQRAATIARTLAAVPGIAVKPDPPHTRMMHVYLHGERALLEAAALEIARVERVALFQQLRPTDVPGWSMFELSVGDAAAALTDEQIGTYLASLPLTRW